MNFFAQNPVVNAVSDAITETTYKSAIGNSIGEFTDEKLYELCRKYGTSALLWRRKFTGLLPEVNRRRLYERKGFSTVSEFAFKLCGLSSDQVRLTLNLGRRFENMPALKKMLEEGEVSINKLARIASIATVENQEELAEKVRVLSVRALETLVRDERFATEGSSNCVRENTVNLFGEIENQNGLSKPLFEGKGLHVQTFGSNDQAGGKTLKCDQKSPCGQTFPLAKRSLSFGTDSRTGTGGLSFELADDVKKELEELNSKGIDVNKFLRKALKQRKEEIEKKKEEIAKELLSSQKKVVVQTPEEDTKDNSWAERNDARGEQDRKAEKVDNIRSSTSEKFVNPVNATTTKPSRYIPAKIKKIIKEEFGTKCSIPTCQKPAEVIHHTQTFGLSHSHDPRFLAPLCKEHHLIAHSMDVKYHEMRNMRS